jgi:hypothetical protein
VFGTHTLIGGLCHKSPPFFNFPNMNEQETFMRTAERSVHLRGKVSLPSTVRGDW